MRENLHTFKILPLRVFVFKLDKVSSSLKSPPSYNDINTIWSAVVNQRRKDDLSSECGRRFPKVIVCLGV